MSLKNFLDSPDSPAQPLKPYRNIFLHIQYNYYIETLFNIFGKDNAGIFFLEDLKNNYLKFINSIYNFIGVKSDIIPKKKVKKSLEYLPSNLFRFFNKFT